MTIPVIGSVKQCSRVEQHATFKALRETSSHLGRLNRLQHLLRPVAYFMLIYFLAWPLLDWNSFAFIVIIVSTTMLWDEMFWRLVVLPAVDREILRQG